MYLYVMVMPEQEYYIRQNFCGQLEIYGINSRNLPQLVMIFQT